MKIYETGLMQAFARAAEKPEGISGNDFVEAILYERLDLRAKIKSGEVTAYSAEYGLRSHTVIIGNEVFKGPREPDLVSVIDNEHKFLQGLEGNDLPAPIVTCVGQYAVFFGMTLMPGVEVERVRDEMTDKEADAFAKDLVSFIIQLAETGEYHGLLRTHGDLHSKNVFVDPHTKKFIGVIDFGSAHYTSKHFLGRTHFDLGRLDGLVAQEYKRRKDEVGKPSAVASLFRKSRAKNAGARHA